MTELAQLTQRIGELIQQVNERDAMIADLTRDLFEANAEVKIFRDFYRRQCGMCIECGGPREDGVYCSKCDVPPEMVAVMNKNSERKTG